MAYAEWLATQGPSWILDPVGKALARTTGAAYDAQRDRILQGVLARFPTAGQLDTDPTSSTFGQLLTAPTDALDEIGADRELRRGPGESDAAYAARLLAAWDIWPFAGSHYGVLRALKIAGYVGAITLQDNGRWAKLTGSAGTIADLTIGSLMTCADRAGSPPGWTFDGRTTFYSRMGIVFEATAANLESVSGQAILNAIVNEWRPAGTAFVGTWVILAGNLLGWPLARVLGGGETLGGDSQRFIPGDGSPPFVTGP
jgi:hypothetical protein